MGITFVEQPATAIAAVRTRVEAIAESGKAAPFALACLSVMTTLTGSVLIALALTEGAISLDDAWHAAHVDEDFAQELLVMIAALFFERALKLLLLDHAHRDQQLPQRFSLHRRDH